MKILGESISRGEMTLSDAKDIARRALFENSNKLYNLELQLKPFETGTPPISLKKIT
jgi:hypothetical protein